VTTSHIIEPDREKSWVLRRLLRLRSGDELGCFTDEQCSERLDSMFDWRGDDAESGLPAAGTTVGRPGRGYAPVTRRFTDRDGVEWRIEWRSGMIAVGALDVEKISLPPGGLHFKSGGLAFRETMSEIDPNELTEEELQRMIDDSGRDG